ncbi:hypothetical protein V2E39_20895 [Chryseobacterium arthrosphaerae]|uniref:Uncharacterized protein n=1 Tax=Chryseobacterium arthrosphaerae TaxID=651561 RepID=A0ABU7R550_9FLAO|nr:hypothetical protein [Chryseobacterium arthrosphaerae]
MKTTRRIRAVAVGKDSCGSKKISYFNDNKKAVLSDNKNGFL